MWIIWISFLVAQWLTYTGKVKGVAHNIFISSYQTPEIFALSFDDQTNELQLNRIMFGHGGHPWLTFNRDRTILYGAELDGWSSYRVKGPTDLQFTNFIQASSRCSTAAARHGETVMAVSKFPPYPVYGASSSPCGAVIGTRTDGRLDRIIQNITYTRDSHVQGMALDPQGRYLFSADGNGNSLWFHQVNKNTGRLEGVEEIDFPLNDVNPRRIVIHPSGQFLYVLLQRTSQVAVFELAPESGNRKPTLRYTNLTISLIPSSIDQSKYHASELHISEDGRLLYGTVRYRTGTDDSDDSSFTSSPRTYGPKAPVSPAAGVSGSSDLSDSLDLSGLLGSLVGKAKGGNGLGDLVDGLLSSLTGDRDGQPSNPTGDINGQPSSPTGDKDNLLSKLAGDTASLLSKITADKEKQYAKVTADRESLLAKLTADRERQSAKLAGDQASLFAKLTADRERQQAKLAADRERQSAKLAGNRERQNVKRVGDREALLSKLTEDRQGLLYKLTEGRENLLSKITEDRENLLSKLTEGRENLLSKITEDSEFERRSVKSKSTTRTLEKFVAENTHTVLRRYVPDEVNTEIPEVKSRIQNENTGFVTAVLLADPINGPKGMPLSVLMQAATGTSGGRSNIVVPAPWDPGHFILVDSEMGLAQIWRLDGLSKLPRDGPRGNFQQLSSTDPFSPIDQGYAGVRTSIVAEWKAPPAVVGSPYGKGGTGGKGGKGRGNNRLVESSFLADTNEYQGHETSSSEITNYNVPYENQNWEDSDDRSEPLSQETDQDGDVKTFQKRQILGDAYRSQPPTNISPNTIPSGRGCCANAIWLN